METLQPTNSLNILMVLLIVASSVGFVVRFIKMPYPIALVIAGLAISAFNLLPHIKMTPEIIMVIYLPALLFEASWNIDIKQLFASLKTSIYLATIGVLFSIFFCGWMVGTFTAFNFMQALLFGAMISATDPITVMALFRNSKVDPGLVTLLEAESLFNDGTAVVCYQMLLAMIISQVVPSPGTVILNFITTVIGGSAVGLLVGFLGSRAIKYFDDHLMETTLTVIVAYGSYLVANHLQVSAVLATICAGIVVGNYGSRTAMNEKTRLAVDAFWEYAAFIVNSIVFLLIGLQIPLQLLAQNALLITVGLGAVFLARIVIIYVPGPLLNSRNFSVPLNYRHILFAGGMRGSLSMALALSLPVNLPGRETLVVLTFGVVLLSLLIPGVFFDAIMKNLLIESQSKSEGQTA
ncbi:MAG: cation:proton antiporter [Candidatus Obscuribacterales bacterium]|nr:cation:proton antiporter [Candidatus Obscuribacterales bacterium]